MIGLQSTAQPMSVVEKLRELARLADNVVGSGVQGVHAQGRYLDWATNCFKVLAFDLTPRAMKELIATPRHDLLYAMDASTWEVMRDMVVVELQDRSRTLNQAADEIRSELQGWGGGNGVAIILDTNVLLSYGTKLLEVDWNRKLNHFFEIPFVFGVPMKVIDELENLKDRGSSDARSLARAAVKMIETTFRHGMVETLAPGKVRGDRPSSVLAMRIMVDSLDHAQLPNADSEIVDRALSVAPFVQETWLVSNDTGMIFRARSARLKTAKLDRSDFFDTSHESTSANR